jgi:hypothetical protein
VAFRVTFGRLSAPVSARFCRPTAGVSTRGSRLAAYRAVALGDPLRPTRWADVGWHFELLSGAFRRPCRQRVADLRPGCRQRVADLRPGCRQGGADRLAGRVCGDRGSAGALAFGGAVGAGAEEVFSARPPGIAALGTLGRGSEAPAVIAKCLAVPCLAPAIVEAGVCVAVGLDFPATAYAPDLGELSGQVAAEGSGLHAAAREGDEGQGSESDDGSRGPWSESDRALLGWRRSGPARPWIHP